METRNCKLTASEKLCELYLKNNGKLFSYLTPLVSGHGYSPIRQKKYLFAKEQY